MDKRETFDNTAHLYRIVQQKIAEQKMVHLIIDNNGLERVSGRIASVSNYTNAESARIQLDTNETFLLKDVIGIDGVFRSDYSEC